MSINSAELGIPPSEFKKEVGTWHRSHENFYFFNEKKVVLALSSATQVLSEVLEGKRNILHREEGEKARLSKEGKDLVKALYRDYRDATSELPGEEGVSNEALLLYAKAAKEIFAEETAEGKPKKYRRSKSDEEISFRMVVNGLEARARYGVKARIETWLKKVIIPDIESGELKINKISSELIQEFFGTLPKDVDERNKRIAGLPWELTNRWEKNHLLAEPNSVAWLYKQFIGTKAEAIEEKLKEGDVLKGLAGKSEKLKPEKAGIVRSLFKKLLRKPAAKLTALATLVTIPFVAARSSSQPQEQQIAAMVGGQTRTIKPPLTAPAPERPEPLLRFVDGSQPELPAVEPSIVGQKIALVDEQPAERSQQDWPLAKERPQRDLPKQPETSVEKPVVEQSAEPVSAAEKPLVEEVEVLTTRDFLAPLVNPTLLPDLLGDPALYSSLRIAGKEEGETFWDQLDPRSKDLDLQFVNLYGFPQPGGFGRYYIEQGYDGQKEYVLVPTRNGPGLAHLIFFVHDNPHPIKDSAHDNEWAGLSKVGNVRIYFDGESEPRVDMSAQDLVSGKAFPETIGLGWKAEINGANACLLPFSYKKSIKIATTGLPRWFTVGVTDFPEGTQVESFDGTFDTEMLARFNQAKEDPAKIPELNNLERQDRNQAVNAENPLVVEFKDGGTIGGFQFKIPKGAENDLWLQVHYEGEESPAIFLPLKDFFTSTSRFKVHQSHLLGIKEIGDSYLFYSNIAMPFGKGVKVSVTRSSGDSVKVEASFFLSEKRSNKRLRAWQDLGTRLETGDGKNYEVNLEAPKGGGRVVAFFLDSWDYRKNPDDPWPLPFAEGNVQIIRDGELRAEYTGMEDFFLGGYYFRQLLSVSQGVPNPLPGGILGFNGTNIDNTTGLNLFRVFPGYDAPTFEKNLKLSIGHGYKGAVLGDNISVTYAAKILYYAD